MPTPFCPSCIPLLHTLLHFPLAQLSLPFPSLHALAIYAHRHRPSRSQRLQPFLVSVTCGVCMFSMDLPLLKARLGLYDLWPSANMEASLIHALSFRAYFFSVVATSARCCYRLFDIDYAPPPPRRLCMAQLPPPRPFLQAEQRMHHFTAFLPPSYLSTTDFPTLNQLLLRGTRAPMHRQMCADRLDGWLTEAVESLICHKCFMLAIWRADKSSSFRVYAGEEKGRGRVRHAEGRQADVHGEIWQMCGGGIVHVAPDCHGLHAQCWSCMLTSQVIGFEFPREHCCMAHITPHHWWKFVKGNIANQSVMQKMMKLDGPDNTKNLVVRFARGFSDYSYQAAVLGVFLSYVLFMPVLFVCHLEACFFILWGRMSR